MILVVKELKQPTRKLYAQHKLPERARQGQELQIHAHLSDQEQHSQPHTCLLMSPRDSRVIIQHSSMTRNVKRRRKLLRNLLELGLQTHAHLNDQEQRNDLQLQRDSHVIIQLTSVTRDVKRRRKLLLHNLLELGRQTHVHLNDQEQRKHQQHSDHQ